ncbi:unnamed protein product, partial [Allacma fusca]
SIAWLTPFSLSIEVETASRGSLRTAPLDPLVEAFLHDNPDTETFSMAQQLL